MACKRCSDVSTLFREKIGQCRDCTIKLTLLSLVAWPLWFYLNAQNPRSIETLVALLFSGFFSGLLGLHAIVWILTGGKGLAPPPQKKR